MADLIRFERGTLYLKPVVESPWCQPGEPFYREWEKRFPVWMDHLRRVVKVCHATQSLKCSASSLSFPLKDELMLQARDVLSSLPIEQLEFSYDGVGFVFDMVFDFTFDRLCELVLPDCADHH